MAEANRLKEPSIVTASTGNAASALAAVCAAAGKQAIIFVPESAPKAKLVQMVLYGARVIPVRGSYDDAFRLSLEYTARKGGLNRNTAYHPLTIEGKKTVGLEIYEQNRFRVPDVILVPVGDGVIISGVFKAFYDLKAAGSDRQAAAAGLCPGRAFRGHPSLHPHRQVPQCPAARHHRRLDFRLHSLQCAHGPEGGARKPGIFGHRDRQGDSARAEALAEKTGVFAEPAAAATVAALRKLRGSDIAGPQRADRAPHHGPRPERC